MLPIGEGDEKFDHLQKAAQDLAKKLLKKRPDLIGHTLVGLDPHIAVDDPVLEEAEAALRKYWRTFRNLFPDRPRQLLRAVVLEALHIAGEGDPVAASIIWLAGGAYLPYTRLGQEQEICRQFLLRMGDIAEKKAVAEWSGTHELSLPPPPSFAGQVLQVDVPTLDESTLKGYLTAAAGPQTPSGPSGNDPNPYWPHNSPPQWAEEFGSRAATGIVEVVDDSLDSLQSQVAQTLSQLDAQLTEYLSLMSGTLSAVLARNVAGAAAYERRVQLLWWKETLYSPTLHRGYRSLDAAAAAAIMAFDLHAAIPAPHPQSVEFLLHETVHELALLNDSAALQSVPLAEWCQQLLSSPNVSTLKTVFGSSEEVPGRLSLVRFVRRLLAAEPLAPEQVADRVGIANVRIKAEDLAVWIFRDLQAHRLASSK